MATFNKNIENQRQPAFAMENLNSLVNTQL